MKGHIFLLFLVVGQIIAEDCFKENVKITGKLLTKKKTFFLDMEDCLALCKETKGCLGVNYIADHKKKSNIHRCLMFKKIKKTTAKKAKNIFSAIVSNCMEFTTQNTIDSTTDITIDFTTKNPVDINTQLPPYKLQPEDPGCYTSDCPSDCQLVLIAKHYEPKGGLYYGIPALESHIAVSPNTRLYKSTAATTVGALGKWAATYYMFHHKELNMWVIGEGEEALISLGSENILAQSGNSGPRVVPEEGSQWYEHLWTWESIMPLCLDDNTCRSYMPDETSRSLMHESYPFSENRNGKMVTQFTYKGETYEHSQRTDSEGAILYATRGVPMDLPINGLTNMEKANATPKRYRVLSYSDRDGFRDIDDFDPSLAMTNRLNEDRHLQTAAIHTGIAIPNAAGLSDATSWELRMDIRVTHSSNATYFKTVGFGPGGYSGIQQTPDTRRVPSGKNFIFSMWDHIVGGVVKSKSYVDKVNEEANVGGKTGVLLKEFKWEGTGQQMQIDYPWAIGDKTTVIISGSRPTPDSDEWCLTSGLAPPGKEEVWLATFCRKSEQDPLNNWGFSVFIEDWIGQSNCFQRKENFNFKKQRAAVFSDWKVLVDGEEVETEAPRFTVNVNHGYARGLTDAGFLSDNAFYLSTGGWKYDP